jgi:hypothetical protein
MDSANSKDCPASSHPTVATMAMAITTGTKTPLTRSASFAIGALERTRLFHKADNLRQGCVFPDLLGAKLEKAGPVDGCRNDLVARLFCGGDTLARNGGLVNGRDALRHHTVDGDSLPGANHNDISHFDLFHGDFRLFSVPLHRCGFWGKLNQLCDGLRRFSF